MMELRILFAVLFTILELIGKISSEDVKDYEEMAYDRFTEIQEYVNNDSYSEEIRGLLKENGVNISAIDVYYGPHKVYDNAYVFRADMIVNDHILSEVQVIDMRNDEILDYYGLVDNMPLTDEDLAYYQKLLMIR